MSGCCERREARRWLDLREAYAEFHGVRSCNVKKMLMSAEPPLALSKIAARSSPTQPPMEEAPVTRRLVVRGKERTFSVSRRRQEVV